MRVGSIVGKWEGGSLFCVHVFNRRGVGDDILKEKVRPRLVTSHRSVTRTALKPGGNEVRGMENHNSREDVYWLVPR